MKTKTIVMRTENRRGFHKEYFQDVYMVLKERDGYLHAVGQKTGQKFIIRDQIPDNDERIKNKEKFKIQRGGRNPKEGCMEYIVEIIDTDTAL